jgi:hypothetical protein
MVASDRREFHRLHLAKPILGLLDGQNALILDIGVGGAFIEHYGTLTTGAPFQLSFRWKGEDVEFECEAARSEAVRTGGDGLSIVSHTGARFVDASAESTARLNDMMATFVGRVLAAQRANAAAVPSDHDNFVLAQLGGARRARTKGYLAYRFHHGKWTRTASDSPKQPADGFTVAAYEDENEVATLCTTYEAADEEGRNLIRLVAELAVRSAL